MDIIAMKNLKSNQMFIDYVMVIGSSREKVNPRRP